MEAKKFSFILVADLQICSISCAIVCTCRLCFSTFILIFFDCATFIFYFVWFQRQNGYSFSNSTHILHRGRQADKIPGVLLMTGHLNRWLNIVPMATPDDAPCWKFPISWKLFFGPPAPMTLYWLEKGNDIRSKCYTILGIRISS